MPINMYNYLNGNYIVTLNAYGYVKKTALRFNEDLKPDFPDSLDIKINNVCYNDCPYCHESSFPGGGLADLNKLYEKLTEVYKPNTPVEIALGGGDLIATPEIKEHTAECIKTLQDYGFLVRMTLNYKSLQSIKDITKYNMANDTLTNKILTNSTISYGISLDKIPRLNLTNNFITESPEFVFPGIIDNRQTLVFHIIAGVFPPEEFLELVDICSKNNHPILILGYKSFGRGINYGYPEDSIEKLKVILKQVLVDKIFKVTSNKIILGFDNLAIEQLGIKDMVPEEYWKFIYMGDEFSHSMYIDAVKGEYAETSRSTNRVSWDNVKLLDFFKHGKSN